jgi:hypothetical protein
METLLDSVRADGFPDATAEDLVYYFYQYGKTAENCKEQSREGASSMAAPPTGESEPGATPETVASVSFEADVASSVEAPRHPAIQGQNSEPRGLDSVVVPEAGEPVLAASSEANDPGIGAGPQRDFEPFTIRQGIAEIAATFKTEAFSVGQLCSLVEMRYPKFKSTSIRRTFQEMAPTFVRVRHGLYRNPPASGKEADLTIEARADRPYP